MNKAEKIAALTDFAEQRIARWCPGWAFLILNMPPKNLGLCQYFDKSIRINARHLDAFDFEKLKDTVLHEIAHALTPHDRGHGRAWQLACLQVGAEPQRAAEWPEGYNPGFTWFRVCPGCDYRQGYLRKPTSKKRRSCAKCNPYAFDERFEMRVVSAKEI